MLSGNPLEFVGVMDLIQPLKTKEIESKLKVNWKKTCRIGVDSSVVVQGFFYDLRITSTRIHGNMSE